MKLVPTILVEDLAELGHDVDTAMSEGLAGHEDPEVWSGAQAAGRMLLTQALDSLMFEPLHLARNPGLVRVRMREPGLSALRTRLLAVFRVDPVEALAGCFVVVTDRKVRVRRPRAT